MNLVVLLVIVLTAFNAGRVAEWRIAAREAAEAEEDA